jgi:hypothetical protein
MTKKNKKKDLARELQQLGGGTVSYTACQRLIHARGFDAAKKQVQEWLMKADAEVLALKAAGAR